MNEKRKQGFATFFGRASLGRKLSAAWYWAVCILLLVLLFTPLVSPIISLTSDKFSLFTYLTSVEAIIGNQIIGIVLSILYILLCLCILICGFFTMNILSFIWTIACILEAVILYFASIRIVFSVSIVYWILLAVIGVFSIVGLVFHFILRGQGEEPGDIYVDVDDSRDVETGLAGTIATLKRLNTNETFNIFDNSEILLGKNPEQVHIVIANSAVSRIHAKITSRNGSCVIEDMGSSNGTFVNDQRLIKGIAYPLKGNTYITLGNEVLQFEDSV